MVTNNLVSAPEEGEENNNQYSLTVTPSATSVYENNTISFTVESTLPQDAALTVESDAILRLQRQHFPATKRASQLRA